MNLACLTGILAHHSAIRYADGEFFLLQRITTSGLVTQIHCFVETVQMQGRLVKQVFSLHWLLNDSYFGIGKYYRNKVVWEKLSHAHPLAFSAVL